MAGMVGGVFASRTARVLRSGWPCASQDYHRFHFPVSGTLGSPRDLGGKYYAVNPVVVNTECDVFTENRRSVALIDSEEFGKVAFVAVGATLVGSIVLTAQPGSTVRKGDEYGYFAYGGSTTIAVFQKGRVKFDEDILATTRKYMETLVQMGNRIGEAMPADA